MDRGAWRAAVHGTAQSRTRLERRSSSSSSSVDTLVLLSQVSTHSLPLLQRPQVHSYVCLSAAALQTGSSLPFPAFHMCAFAYDICFPG